MLTIHSQYHKVEYLVFLKLPSLNVTHSLWNLGDLKESPPLGESSHVTFSRMAKYCSYTFSEQQPKAFDYKVCMYKYLFYMYRAVKGSKYVLFLEYLTSNCSCVQKEDTKQKEIFHLVDPRTLLNKAAEAIF